jgi:NADH-quinone oxidoreductase subunit L
LFAIGVLALSGVPPLSGFFSKELILGALEEHPVALVLGLATTLMTPYYMGRAFLLAFGGGSLVVIGVLLKIIWEFVQKGMQP